MLLVAPSAGALREWPGFSTLVVVSDVDSGAPRDPNGRSVRRAPSRGGSAASGSSGRGSDDVLERLAKIDDAPRPVDAAPVPLVIRAEPARPSVRVQASPPPPAAVGTATGAVGWADSGVGTVAPASSDMVDGSGSDAALAGLDALEPSTAAGHQRTIIGRIKRRPRVRRVTRVVRHVDTWSVFKVALVFNGVLYLVCLTAGVLLWNVATATGTIANVEKFFEQFGWQSFQFKGGQIYHNAWVGGLFVALGMTGLFVLVATVFNLITDLVGGIRVSVLEEEVVARDRPRS